MRLSLVSWPVATRFPEVRSMSMSFKSISFSIFAALTLHSLSACTLAAPGESQDGVSRCGAPEDCGDGGLDLKDNRHAYTCIHADGGGQVPGVCEPAYRAVDCGFVSSALDDYSKLAGTLRKIEEKPEQTLYKSKCSEGVVGCAPKGGACDDKAMPVTVKTLKGEIEVCPPGDKQSPVPVAYVLLDPEYPEENDKKKIIGLDLRNQFCAWYFCDTSFVCNTSGGEQSQWSCMPCDPAKAPSEGGCNTINVGDDPSPIYKDVVPDGCNKGEADIKDVVFGTPPAAKK